MFWSLWQSWLWPVEICGVPDFIRYKGVEYHTLRHFVMCSDNKSSMHRVGAGRNRFSVLRVNFIIALLGIGMILKLNFN